MGKAKKKRGHGKKHGKQTFNPITNECYIEKDEELEDDAKLNKSDHLDKILDTVCSTASYEQKECVLATIANLAQEKEAVMRLLEKGIVKKLGPLLADENPEVKEKVAGTFRNLSAAGGTEACKLMVKNDIMTSIGCALKKDIVEIDRLMKSGKEFETLLKLFSSLKEMIVLLWNLCEASSLAVKLFNKDHLLQPLVTILCAEDVDPSLTVVSAQCLYTITEENDEAIAMLINNTGFLIRMSALQSLRSNSKQMLVASLASGILYNLRKSLPESDVDQLTEKIVSVISQVLEVKPVEALQAAMASNDQENDMENMLDYLSAKQLCLELLANLFCADVDEDWEDMEVSAEDDFDENVEEVQLPSDLNPMSAAKLELPIFKLLLQYSIPLKILPCMEVVRKDSVSLVKDAATSERILRAYKRVQKSALVCFNNMLSECPIEIIGDSSGLESIWNNGMLSLTSQQDDIDEESIDGYTGLLRAVAFKMAEANNYKFISPQSMGLFDELSKRCINDSAKCNLLGILGVAGKFVAQQPDGLTALEGIGRTLCSATNMSNSIIVITEALDAVFDVFAEGGIADEALLSTGLATQLRQMPPLLKAKIKTERCEIKENLPVIDMARTNLIRFIKYKQLKM